MRPDMARYREWSARVWDLVRELSPAVEVVGLDEGYLELPDEGAAEAADARAAGGGRARAALLLAGGRDLQGRRQGRLRPRQARRRHGGGARRRGRLPRAAAAARAARAWARAPRSAWPRAGLATVGDLAALGDEALRGLVPGRFGEDLRRRARGIDPRPVAAVPAERISVSAETTFERDVTDPARLESVGRGLAEKVAEALRRRGRAGRTVTVKLRYADFQTITRGQTVAAARRRRARRSGRRPRRCSRARCASGPGPCGCSGSGCRACAPTGSSPSSESRADRVRAMSGSATASGERLVRVVGAARAALEARAGEIDDLNVFPVADGDTGTNMLLTAVAVEEAAAATTGLPWPERCAALARAALMGARGNSGMILSQLVRGAAESLAAEGGDLGGAALARALRRASETAYAAVRHPVEGTMLTVARAHGRGRRGGRGRHGPRGGPGGGARGRPARRRRDARPAGGPARGRRRRLRRAGPGGPARGPRRRAARPRGGAADRRRPPARRRGRPRPVALPLLHQLPGGGLGDRPRRARGVAAVAGRQPAGDGRRRPGQGARPHRHPRAGRRGGAALGGGHGAPLRRHAPPGGRARRPPAPGGHRRRRPAPPSRSSHGEGVRELAEGLGASGARRRTPAPARSRPRSTATGAPETVVVAAGPEGLAAARAAAGGRAGVVVVDAGSLPAALACLVGLDPEARADANAGRDARAGGGRARRRGRRRRRRRPAGRAARPPWRACSATSPPS